ncbi:hypothetical protein JTB14_012549 [Gonioctena quinquepunctata]|nr:hypothetical protein JTB14_012549 [Gonioctena quinquepunctata]
MCRSWSNEDLPFCLPATKILLAPFFHSQEICRSIDSGAGFKVALAQYHFLIFSNPTRTGIFVFRRVFLTLSGCCRAAVLVGGSKTMLVLLLYNEDTYCPLSQIVQANTMFFPMQNHEEHVFCFNLGLVGMRIFESIRFRPHIEGTRFTARTDHNSPLWLNNHKNPSGKLSKWALCLRQHRFDSVHRKCCKNIIPDALSLIPPNNMDDLDQTIHKSVSVESIAFCKIDPEQVDSWYTKFRNEIIEDYDEYPQWEVANNTFKFPLKTRST